MPVTIGPFTDVPAPDDPVASAWAQEITAFAVNNITIGPTQPTDPNAELWYDTSDPGVASIAALPRGYVGHAVPGAATTSITSTVKDIVGMSVTFTADPTRRYKTTMVTYRIDQAAATGNPTVSVANAANSQLPGAAIESITLAPGQFGYVTCVAITSGLSGVQTHKGRISVDAGSCVLQAGGLILVEDIGGF